MVKRIINRTGCLPCKAWDLVEGGELYKVQWNWKNSWLRTGFWLGGILVWKEQSVIWILGIRRTCTFVGHKDQCG